MKSGFGYVYLVGDKTGLKLGSSGEENIERRIKSVMRGRGTGTCKELWRSKKLKLYKPAEDWIRWNSIYDFNLPWPINEWHNFDDPRDITNELIERIKTKGDSYDDVDPKFLFCSSIYTEDAAKM